MRIYAKILTITLPLILVSLVAAVGITYLLSRQAITSTAETGLDAQLTLAMREAEAQATREGQTAAEARAEFEAFLASLGMGETGVLYAIDTTGRVAVHPDPEVVGLSVEEEPWFAEMRREHQGGLTYTWMGSPHLARYTYFKPLGLYLVAMQANQEVYHTIDQAGWYILLAIVPGTLALGVVLVAMARRLTAPLSDLALGAEQVAQGNLSVQIPVRSADEFGQLAGTLNEMIAKVQGMVTGLEQEVRERTRTLERRSTELQVAAEVARDATAVRRLDDLLNRTTDLIRERFGFYHAALFLIDESGEYAVLRGATGEVGRQFLKQGFRLRVGEEGLIGYVTATGRARIVLDVRQDETYMEHPLLADTNSEMALPLKVGERVIGALDVQSKKADAFDEGDIVVLQTMADQLAIAIENAHLLEQSKRHAGELLLAAEVARDATSARELDDLLARAADLIQERFGFYFTSIFLLDEPGDYAVLQAATGRAGRQMLASNYRLRVGEANSVSQVATTGQSRIILDVRQDPIALRNPFLPETRSEMTLALKAGDRLIGVLDIQSHREQAFDKDDVAALQTMADQLAVAIENVRAYEQQRELASKLRELDELKMQFMANMSHELRTPLNAIIGFSRVMLKGIDGPITDQQQKDLTMIHEAGQHLLGLINDILDIAKIEAGKMNLSFEEVELERIIDGVLSTTTGLIKDKALKLRRDVPEPLPIVLADETRIRQVLLNLLSNAAKFTDQGEICLSAVVAPPDVLFTVSDTGVGIPADKLDHLFEAFYQVDGSAARKAGGSGLGLAITHYFVEMHGGRIWVESNPGQGTSFYFTLPIAGPPEQIEKPRQPIVLAIDDKPSIANLYGKQLASAGYRLVSLREDDDLLAAIQTHRPHVLLFDMKLHDTANLGLVRQVRQHGTMRDLPIVVCSLAAGRDAALEAGADIHLIKPILWNDLLVSLRHVMAPPHIRRSQALRPQAGVS